MKKFLWIVLVSFYLASCSLTTKTPTLTETLKPLPLIPITSSGSSGATSTGFSNDLNWVVEKAYKDANK